MLVRLKDELSRSVMRNKGEGLLFSGGLDSSILAYLAPDAKTFTVRLETYGSDMEHAQMLADHLGIEHRCLTISVDDAIAIVPTVIKILRSFDPAIPNDVATYFGLISAKEHGCKSIMTGDGGDELFAGYDFMLDLDLNDYIPKMARRMSFSSKALGEFIGIEVKQPYIDPEFVEFALGIEPKLKVNTVDGKKCGKWILRKAFENNLPSQITWRKKVPIEYGSGTTELRAIIESRISDMEFREKQQIYPIRFRNKEHLFYYEIYRDVVGAIPLPKDGEKQCSECGAGVKVQLSHCRVCGGFPV